MENFVNLKEEMNLNFNLFIFKVINIVIYINKFCDEYYPKNKYELRFMHELDKSDKVIYWSYERRKIKYSTNKFTFPDFYIEFDNGDTYIVELKSREQIRKRKKIDLMKFKACEKYCFRYGYVFLIVKNEEISKIQIS